MAFGQRGVQPAGMQRAVAAPAPAHIEDEPKQGLFSGVLGKSEDHLDLDFGIKEDYAPGKSLSLVIPLWLFFGGWGAHRFYLGHWRFALVLSAAASMVGVALFLGFFTATTEYLKTNDLIAAISTFGKWLPMMVVFSLWVFFDGIYVIIKMLTSR